MRIYLQRQRFFFWKGWGSAGRPECAGLAELLEEVAYFSGFQENGLMRCSPFFGLFFVPFLSGCMFSHLSFVFWNLSFLFVFFFLPFFPLILIILPLGPSCFLSFFSSLLLTFSPPPLHPRLPLFSPWFLSLFLSLILFSFCLLLPPLTFPFFRFLLFPSLFLFSFPLV